MNANKLRQLAARLAGITSVEQYFTELFTSMEGDPRYGVLYRKGRAVRVVFFGEHIDNRLAKAILDCPSSTAAFAGTEELRVISTEMDRSLAEEFKKFNPRMRIVFQTVEEWVTRPVGSPNPGTISEDLPPRSNQCG